MFAIIYLPATFIADLFKSWRRLEVENLFLPLGSTVPCCGAFAAPPAAVDEAAERFFKDFDIKILRSVKAASRRTTEAPPRPSGRRGSRWQTRQC